MDGGCLSFASLIVERLLLISFSSRALVAAALFLLHSLRVSIFAPTGLSSFIMLFPTVLSTTLLAFAVCVAAGMH